ncbi:MAG TPA: HAD family hydrolase [Terracidiphilus sp.]|nr:HAD family hydrolase [Terracidiphilus sp.]
MEWTVQDLEHKVRDLRPKVAVFDCDGTLWGGDAGFGFMTWTLEQGIVSRSTSDWIDTRHRAYRAGDVSEVQICGEMVQIYAGLREEELRGVAARYVEQFVRPQVFAEIAGLVETLRQRGTEIWAVSSTNKWVICEGVRAFGIPEERVLAAEVAVRDGIITSEIVDVPTGEGKAVALARVGLARPDAVFGNSVHDLAMMEMAVQVFPINPSAALMDAAARNGWGYYRPLGARAVYSDIAGE